MEINFTWYTECVCGAITLEGEDGLSYSCARKNLKRFLPSLDLRKVKRAYKHKTCCCDHCVNHYGLDLCACGSGEPYEKCDAGLEVCGQPMQKVGEYDCVVAKDSWLHGGKEV